MISSLGVKKKNNSSRRGIVDLIIVIILIFTFSIGILANDVILTAANNSALGTDGYPHIHESLLMNRTFNEGFLFLVVGYMIYMLIAAYIIDSHPIFYVIGLMIGMVGITIAEYLREAWVDATNNTAIQAIIGNYTYHTLIWNNMVYIVLGIIALSLIAMYSKGGGRGPIG